jgi:hypothetical protein
MSDYNGWTNRETWALNLHLSNNEGDYNYWTERAQEACADNDTAEEATDQLVGELKSWTDDLYEAIEHAATTAAETVTREAWSLLTDVGMDTSQIDYREIATSWIGEAWTDKEEEE